MNKRRGANYLQPPPLQKRRLFEAAHIQVITVIGNLRVQITFRANCYYI